MEVDLTTEHKLEVLFTDLKDNFLTPLKAEILYTGDNFGRTVSIQFNKQQITFDYDKLKKIIEGDKDVS